MSEHEDVAEATLKESIKLARAANDPHVQAIALNNLGNLYSYRQEHEQAVKNYKAAMDLATADQDSVASMRRISPVARRRG